MYVEKENSQKFFYFVYVEEFTEVSWFPNGWIMQYHHFHLKFSNLKLWY